MGGWEGDGRRWMCRLIWDRFPGPLRESMIVIGPSRVNIFPAKWCHTTAWSLPFMLRRQAHIEWGGALAVRRLPPHFKHILPLYRRTMALPGQVSPFYARTMAFPEQVSPFYARTTAFLGQVSAFYACATAMHEQLSPLYRSDAAFHGQMSPFPFLEGDGRARARMVTWD